MVLRVAQRKYPDDFWINFQLAWSFEYAAPPKKDLAEAVRFYSVALALRPRNVPTHLFLGRALRNDGKLDEALGVYRRAIVLAPDNVVAHYGLGCTLLARKEVDVAIAAFSKAIELNPQLAVGHHKLAWLLATDLDPKVRNPGRAVELAKKAVGLGPKQAEYWSTLGTAHYRAGDWRAATEALQKALELRNGTPGPDWFVLAMTHWRLGHKAEAREWYYKGIQWMHKGQMRNEELWRLRAEAEEVLAITKNK
jgi:tetratricopeptide (TPR) repeat protein